MKTHNTCETLPSQATNCVCVGGGGGGGTLLPPRLSHLLSRHIHVPDDDASI